MDIPTEDDWRSEPWHLDLDWAYKNFHGKTFAEAVRLFEDNALVYQEDVMYMPGRVFRYYGRAYIAYLLSDTARGDSDGASCFIGLINHKAEFQPDDIRPLWSEIEPVLHKLAEHQDEFGADWMPYRSFRARIHEIVQRGFSVSFDTASPEIVPTSVTLRDLMGLMGSSTPWPVAVQLLRNTGYGQFDATSRKEDIVRVFGTPDDTGGGHHAQYGFIPHWIRYNLPDYGLRFEFDGDSPVALVVDEGWIPPQHGRPPAQR
ncbi:MAG: hypothetical protein P4L84_30600 [Isosphaeraceae bacterium]|nr:hypothetical protein [Isosphaeraceae bacterium]